MTTHTLKSQSRCRQLIVVLVLLFTTVLLKEAIVLAARCYPEDLPVNMMQRQKKDAVL